MSFQKVPGQHSELARGMSQATVWLQDHPVPLSHGGQVPPREDRDTGSTALSLLLDISQPLRLPTDPSTTPWCR